MKCLILVAGPTAWYIQVGSSNISLNLDHLHIKVSISTHLVKNYCYFLLPVSSVCDSVFFFSRFGIVGHFNHQGFSLPELIYKALHRYLYFSWDEWEVCWLFNFAESYLALCRVCMLFSQEKMILGKLGWVLIPLVSLMLLVWEEMGLNWGVVFLRLDLQNQLRFAFSRVPLKNYE